MVSEKWFAQLPLKQIESVTPVSGGDINEAFRVETIDATYFVLRQPNHDASFYDHEVEGLHLLSQAALVPQVIGSGTIGDDAFLILNWINTGHGSQRDLGHLVATVHQVHADQFGFHTDVTNGKLPKINTWQSDWLTFYFNQRLDVLVNRAEEHGLWNANRQHHFEQFKPQFELENAHRTILPSLLHGDLWSGNYLFTADGQPMLIDPDVFYGDRELDLAMTTIFGGFDEDFYDAYNQVYPIDPGFEDRLPGYQLYYLLAHLNLFGESYGGAVDRILSRY